MFSCMLWLNGYLLNFVLCIDWILIYDHKMINLWNVENHCCSNSSLYLNFTLTKLSLINKSKRIFSQKLAIQNLNTCSKKAYYNDQSQPFFQWNERMALKEDVYALD